MKEEFIDVTPGDNHMKISEIYVFISSGENGEDVISHMIGDMMVPFACADKARLESLRPLAEKIARVSGKKIKLIRLTHREEIEEIG